MKPLMSVLVVGGGRHAEALAGHNAPFRRFRIARWAAAGSTDADRAAALADRMGVAFSSDWAAVVGDTSLRVVLVLSEDPHRHRVVAEALAAGKAVLCPGPVARPGELADCMTGLRRSRGLLQVPGELRYAPGARAALECIADGEAGTLHSIYIAARTAGRPDDGESSTVIDRLGWDVIDFLLHAADGPVARVHTQAGRLFGSGSGADTAVVIIRFESGLIATAELSECLPAVFPAAPADVEIEVVGTRRAIHVEPYQTAVRVYGAAGPSLHPWADPPVLGMVDDLLDVVEAETAPAGGEAAVLRIAELLHTVDESVRGRASA